MGDHSAGMTLAAAVCAALLARERTGAGQLVTTSLYRQGAYTVSFDLNTYLLTGQPIAIGQRATMGNPCMNNYAAGDGRRFWIVGLEIDRHWPALCRVVGRPEWLTDPRYADARARAGNAVELIAALDEIFATKPLDEWADALRRRTGFLLVADQHPRGRRGRRTVPRRRRDRRRAGRGVRPCRWWPRLRISTARPGRRALWHRNWVSTPTRCSPNSPHVANPDAPRHLYKFVQNCHAVP